MITPIQQKNRRLALLLAMGVIGMAGLSFASAPLYNLFCQATGLGGTTRVATQAPDQILGDTMTVRFNTDVAPGLPWEFSSSQRDVKVKIGEVEKIFYRVRNDGTRPYVGVAVYNVQPERAGLYFHKIQCFCFEDMALASGDSRELPVQFFIDPSIARDEQLKGLKSITLSYTFFSSKSARLGEARKRFTEEQERLLNAAKALP